MYDFVVGCKWTTSTCVATASTCVTVATTPMTTSTGVTTAVASHFFVLLS